MATTTTLRSTAAGRAFFAWAAGQKAKREILAEIVRLTIEMRAAARAAKED
jgi:hypothetical protein